MCMFTQVPKIVWEEVDVCTLRYACTSGMYTSMCGSQLWEYMFVYQEVGKP